MSAPRGNGGRAARAVVVAVVVAALVLLLFTVVFPWFDRTFVDDPVLGAVAVVSTGGGSP